MISTKATADLCDAHGENLHVLAPGLADFGGLSSFSGVVATLKVFEDNALVRTMLGEPGGGRVLVIDGAGSIACALVGGNLAKLAEQNGWSGIVVWGAVRDVSELRQRRIGIRALASNPRKSSKTGAGKRDAPVQIGDVAVHPGYWLAADADGIVVAPQRLD
jgi:regulator of ribonuclease activity A